MRRGVAWRRGAVWRREAGDYEALVIASLMTSPVHASGSDAAMRGVVAPRCARVEAIVSGLEACRRAVDERGPFLEW